MITKDIFYVGVDDHKTDLFEAQFAVPNGMAYNSYLILDEKIAVMDAVSAGFEEEWLEKIKKVCGDRSPDYLVVHHVEPDHSGGVRAFAQAYPEAKIVSSTKAFAMMGQFYGDVFAGRQVPVKEGDSLSLGKHTLSFFAAPMVHWPEVMVSFDSADKVLFSADAFGKFGALDTDEDWACEARRYYFGIVGKYGSQVQTLLKKVQTCAPEIICPLHGPVLKEDLEKYIGLYQTWSSFEPENRGVLIAYTSVYGNTEKAARLLEQELIARGCEKVVLCDLVRSDMAEAVEDAFRYSHLVLASTTYNGDVFPVMRHFLEHLAEKFYSRRTVSFMENGSWAPTAAKVMRALLEKCKDLTFTENNVRILSVLSDESREQIRALAKEIKP